MRLLRMLVPTLALTLGTLIFGAPVSAAQPQAILVGTVPLTFDCSSVPATATAKAMVEQYHLCGQSPLKTTVQSSGAVTPNNMVEGGCGSLSLYVFNSGNGYLQWKAEITSALGPFVAATYAGTWANTWLWQSGLVSRTFLGVTSDWLDIFPILTGYGYVVGRINFAKDLLWWGGSCTNHSVVDSGAQVWSF
jgi:hypothetical protein